MDLSVGKSIRGLFSALALSAAVAVPAGDAQAFGTGSTYIDGEQVFRLQLEDTQDQQTYFQLPMPKDDQQAFREDVIEILANYLAKGEPELSDRQAADFVWLLGRLAEDAGMERTAFIEAIGLEQVAYEQLLHQQYRNGVLEEYDYIKNYVADDFFFSFYGLSFNDQSIAEINAGIEEAQAQHPDDPVLMAAEPLTGQDLVNIRRVMAERIVDTGLEVVRILKNKQPGAARYAEDVEEIVDLLYNQIQIDPENAQWDASPVNGNNYNRMLPDLIDAELAQRGCVGQCRDEFYTLLVQFRNFHYRLDFIPPLPLGVEPETGQPEMVPAP